jgi:hypothetical protein
LASSPFLPLFVFCFFPILSHIFIFFLESGHSAMMQANSSLYSKVAFIDFSFTGNQPPTAD